jgi:hypothetical protein
MYFKRQKTYKNAGLYPALMALMMFLTYLIILTYAQNVLWKSRFLKVIEVGQIGMFRKSFQ